MNKENKIHRGDEMKWKIVTDTGSSIREIENLPENVSFDIIPLILHLDNKDYVDTPDLDTEELGRFYNQVSHLK